MAPSRSQQAEILLARVGRLADEVRTIRGQLEPPRVSEESALLTVLDSAIAITSADFGNVQLYHEIDTSLRIVAQRGFHPPFLTFFSTVTHDGACSAAMKRRQRTLVPDVRSSRLFTEPARQTMLAANVLACQSTPIISTDSRLLGMISTHFRQPHTPTRRELRYIDTLASQAAILLQEFRDHRRAMTPGTVSREVTPSKVRCPQCRSTLEVIETPSGARSVSVAFLGASVESNPHALEIFVGSDRGRELMCPACTVKFDPSEPYRLLPARNRL